MATKYTVIEEYISGDFRGFFRPVGEVTAGSADRAVRAFIAEAAEDEKVDGRRLLAVPTKQWRPRTVRAKVVHKVVIE